MRALIIAALAVLALAASPASAERIARVIDGDTVVTASGEKVRLMGFSAPEMHGECPREERMARDATALLQRLAASGLNLDTSENPLPA